MLLFCRFSSPLILSAPPLLLFSSRLVHGASLSLHLALPLRCVCACLRGLRCASALHLLTKHVVKGLEPIAYHFGDDALEAALQELRDELVRVRLALFLRKTQLACECFVETCLLF